MVIINPDGRTRRRLFTTVRDRLQPFAIQNGSINVVKGLLSSLFGQLIC